MHRRIDVIGLVCLVFAVLGSACSEFGRFSDNVGGSPFQAGGPYKEINVQNCSNYQLRVFFAPGYTPKLEDWDAIDVPAGGTTCQTSTNLQLPAGVHQIMTRKWEGSCYLTNNNLTLDPNDSLCGGLPKGNYEFDPSGGTHTLRTF